ncbi:MAG: response regulator [Desulfosarcina sp.]|nr:response regulator [Desulfobacterales bacterium]
MNILAVDDEAVTLNRVKHYLKKWGYNILTAGNGVEALEKFLSGDIDIILTDWIMPEMDGPELIKQVHKNSKRYVYIILLTSKRETGDLVSALSEGGADDYIVKPFDPEELRARVSVGERTVLLERKLWEYNNDLENTVRMQTRIIRQTQEETIFRLLSALEARDKETGGHVRRIGLYSARLAKAAGWTQDKIDDILIAASMHDIGKIGISDSILCKKGRLTEDEFEIIKSHTIIGGRILGDSKLPMLQMAYDIALCHHEKWDGSGYPCGLIGEQIPEAARLVALVDVYDALGRERIYRKALSEEGVFAKMYKERESHFNPYLFNIFTELIPEFRNIAKNNP